MSDPEAFPGDVDLRRPQRTANPRKEKIREAQRMAQDLRLWELKAQGWSDERIAQETGLSMETVRRRVNEIYSAYRVQLTGAVEAKAAEQVTQYEYIRDEALEAWRRSKKPKNRASKSTTRRVDSDGQDVGDGSTLETTNVSQEEQTGDSRYLDAAMKAMDKIAGLLRFSNALQVDVSVTHQGPDGGPVQVQQLIVHDLNYEELGEEKLGDYLRQLAHASLLVSEPLIAPAQLSAPAPLPASPPPLAQDASEG